MKFLITHSQYLARPHTRFCFIDGDGRNSDHVLRDNADLPTVNAGIASGTNGGIDFLKKEILDKFWQLMND